MKITRILMKSGVFLCSQPSRHSHFMSKSRTLLAIIGNAKCQSLCNPHGLSSSPKRIQRLTRLSASYSTEATGGTMDEEEVRKFGEIADAWWDESGEFKALHTLNRLRVPFIKGGLCSIDRIRKPKPLKGMSVIDIGCGGGLLSEPLARLGAEMTGVDASEENIMMAKLHASRDPDLSNRKRYKCILVEDLAVKEPESYDAVVASEILEHVANHEVFLQSCCDLLKPGGSLFITSLNKTFLSRAIGVFAAERLLRIVPVGAHDWDKFLPVQDLEKMLINNGLTVKSVQGMTMNPLTLTWHWIPDLSINYALHAVKNTDASSSDSSSDSENDDR